MIASLSTWFLREKIKEIPKTDVRLVYTYIHTYLLPIYICMHMYTLTYTNIFCTTYLISSSPLLMSTRTLSKRVNIDANLYVCSKFVTCVCYRCVCMCANAWYKHVQCRYMYVQC